MGVWKKNIIFNNSKNILTKKFQSKTTGDDRLSGVEMFNKELSILQQLEKNFINIPKIYHYPFPKSISYNIVPDEKKFITFTMTNCGTSAWDYYQLETKHQNIKPNNYYNTVECIINNLKNNRIYYRDFKADNVCINTDGHVSLIDFGRFTQWGTDAQELKKVESYYKKPNLDELKKRLYSYVGCSESDFLIEKALVKETVSLDRSTSLRKWKNLIFKRNPWSILYYF